MPDTVPDNVPDGLPDNSPSRSDVPGPVPFRTALRYWLLLGCTSFGGPAGQIAMLHAELVERRRWISEARFLHALNFTMLLPGPEAQQLATYIGWLLHGVRGGLAAGLLFVLPSLLLLCGLSWLYLAWGEVPVVAGLLYGIKPAVVVIVAMAAWRIGRRALSNWLLRSLAVAAFLALLLLKLPFPLIIALAALAGLAGSRFAPELFLQARNAHSGSHGGAHGSPPPTETATASLTGSVARPWRRLALVLGIGLGLWALALGSVQALLPATLASMGWFFTKAALVTFGGAYAVLPYVYQGAVEQFNWLSAVQMIDGLALGESTPGPLIMVVAFVGFVGAWNTQIFGPEQLVLAGWAGAAVVTFFTFLPSFVMVFAGAPLVEATRHNLRIAAPLMAITAAVVGVIVNLAVFFAWHVFWPRGLAGGTEWPALAIGAIGFALSLALPKRASLGVIPLILICGALGVLFRLASSFSGT